MVQKIIFSPIILAFVFLILLFYSMQLVLMKRGGQIIYSGPLGQNSSTLITYFEVSFQQYCISVQMMWHFWGHISLIFHYNIYCHFFFCWNLIFICMMRTSWSRNSIQGPIQKHEKCTERGPRILWQFGSRRNCKIQVVLGVLISIYCIFVFSSTIYSRILLSFLCIFSFV